MGIIKDYWKREKETKKAKNRPQPFKNFNFLTKEYLTLQRKRFENLVKTSTETSREKKLYEEYIKLVKESFKKENEHRKFRLAHVDQLGINYDILFLYGKKDSGKTWQAAHQVRNILEKYPDAQIAFIRNSLEEGKGFKEMMNNSDIWVTWTDGDYVYKKSEIHKVGKYKKHTLKPCGIFVYCTQGSKGMEKWQGGDWKNLKFWYWDECNSIEGGLTHEVFQRVVVFLSSMIRDKTDVKGLMTGNLLEKNNIFLERLGVGSKTKLKIFEVHKDNDPKKEILSTLLYLNTGDLFKGIDEQVGLPTQFLSEEELEGLLTNRPGVNTSKAIYEESDLKNLVALYSFVYRPSAETLSEENAVVNTDYIFYFYRLPNSARLIVWVDRFKTVNIKPGFKALYSPNKCIANKYPMIIPIEEKEEFGESFIENLAQYLMAGEVWFGWNNSQEIFETVWPEFEAKFIKEDSKEK